MNYRKVKVDTWRVYEDNLFLGFIRVFPDGYGCFLGSYFSPASCMFYSCGGSPTLEDAAQHLELLHRTITGIVQAT